MRPVRAKELKILNFDAPADACYTVEKKIDQIISSQTEKAGVLRIWWHMGNFTMMLENPELYANNAHLPTTFTRVVATQVIRSSWTGKLKVFLITH